MEPSAQRAPAGNACRLLVAIKTAKMDIASNQSSRMPGPRVSNLGGPAGGRGVVNDAALVVTVTVAVAGLGPLTVTELGEMLQVASDGAPAQVNTTVPLNPALPVTLTL